MSSLSLNNIYVSCYLIFLTHKSIVISLFFNPKPIDKLTRIYLFNYRLHDTEIIHQFIKSLSIEQIFEDVISKYFDSGTCEL